MKKIKRILGLIAAMSMAVSMGMTSLADESTNTITIDNAVEGETYTAYKLMDADFDGGETNTVTKTTPVSYYYTGDANDVLYGILDDYFQFEAFADGKAQLKVVDDNGDPIDYSEVNVGALATAINDAMDSGSLTLSSAGSDKAEKVNDTIVAEIPVGDKGYYFVNTSLGSVCSIDTAANVTIKEKNTTTTQNKKVQEDSTTIYGDKNDAQIGDTVEFQSTVVIGKHQKNVIFHDVMQEDKLELVPDSITVDGATVDGEAKYEIKVDDADEGDTFTVKFDSDWTESLEANTTVTISYRATLTAAAIIGDQDDLEMGKGNDNKSKVTYGDAQNTEWDWTRTYTWGFNILKYTGSEDDKTPLQGAKFEFKQGGNTLKFTLVSTGDTTKATVYKYDAEGAVTTLETPASGLITLQGLDADTYTLTETEAPVGYNKLLEDVTIVLDSNTDTEQGDDNLSQTGATLTITQNDSDPIDQVEILNNNGTMLPSTGGIGTTILYVIGGILVIGGAAAIIIKRKKDSQ